MLPDLSNIKTKSTGASAPDAVDVAHAASPPNPPSPGELLPPERPPCDAPFPIAPLPFVAAPGNCESDPEEHAARTRATADPTTTETGERSFMSSAFSNAHSSSKKKFSETKHVTKAPFLRGFVTE
jgi:hypothetical protein